MVSGGVALILLVVAIILIVILTSKFKINPFLVLICVSYFYALAIGMKPIDIMDTIRNGFGGLITNIGLIIICGTLMGTLLEKTGGAVSITRAILRLIGKKNAPLAMSLSGYIVSIPVICDPGFIILNTVSKGLSTDTGISMVVMSLALASGLYATHTLVPPTAGPTAVAGELGANLAQVIMYGALIAVVVSLVAWIWATKFGKKTYIAPSDAVTYDDVMKKYGRIPNIAHALLPILYPLLMICLSSFSVLPSKPFGDGTFATIIRILGNPSLALFVSVLLAFTLVPKESLKVACNDWMMDGLKDSASIVFITAAGGAFGAVLRESPMVEYIGASLSTAHLGVFLPFVIAAVLKSAQGSSTVAMITTAGIMSPMIAQLGINPVVCVMAIGSGSMIVSHANDSFFWVVSQFSGMGVDTTLKNYTTMTGIMGLTSIACTFILSFFI